jgi:phosphatidylglycerol:prolipoprotein diacylglycerol transferase
MLSLLFPHIDPVLISLGPLHIRWYGLAYVLGFLSAYILIRFQLARQRPPLLSLDRLSDLFFYMAMGLILGARLGYVFFYNLGYYLQNPVEVAAFWRGGMSFHGGLLGVFLGTAWFCRKNRISILALGDLLVLPAPIGLGLGRLANFINGELYGRVTDLPWGMVFPSGGPLPRHPSQLYEAFLEGLLLFFILWVRRKSLPFPGAQAIRFLMAYGLIRFGVEFFREPDVQVGYWWGFLTTGQILGGLMVFSGAALFIYKTGLTKKRI